MPHRTGARGDQLYHDEIVAITRATLVRVSASSIVIVLDSLLSLLADLARPYKTVAARPNHVILSELYVLALIADCCSSHWGGAPDDGSVHELPGWQKAKLPPPAPLDEGLVHRVFEAVRIFLIPVPDGHMLLAQTILDDSTSQPGNGYGTRAANAAGYSRISPSAERGDILESAALLEARSAETECHVRIIIEYVTASSWSAAFEYFRNAVYGIRTAAPLQVVPATTPAASDEEKAALVVVSLISSFWVDRHRLGLVIQELCSSFLHFRKPLQNAVAVVAPRLISRWIDRYPGEFVQLHYQRQRIDGSPDTLFDMAQTVVDGGRKRGLQYPLQMALLLLLPDVFEVASNMREAKGGGMAKKIAFLDGLRKALRNRNEQAAYCLVSLLRAARHFDAESDSALMSYAMDVQDEVRDAVFRRFPAGAEPLIFEQDILTAAFVSLGHLNFDVCADALAQSCLVPSAPQGFKTAVVQACSHFARLDQPSKYQSLFAATAPFVQAQLKAMSSLFAETYIGDQTATRKAVESASSIAMVCNILSFLDASPSTLFHCGPDSPPDREECFDDNFEAFVSCMIAADESVRRLAAGVAKRLFADETVLKSAAASGRLSSPHFKSNFWKLTWVLSLSRGAARPSLTGA